MELATLQHALVGAVVGYLLLRLITWIIQWKMSPFAYSCSKPRSAPYVYDQSERAKVIKQNFTIEKVPTELDVIIIGAGAGGLATASLLAKAGKKVLVLEQHDQAGGGMHTFIEKGYEFEPGLHYVGFLSAGSLGKTLMDQITGGQVEWAPMEDVFDRCSIGFGEDIKFYDILKGGGDEWKNYLKEKFPDEHEAVDKYFEVINGMGKLSQIIIYLVLKVLPLWASWILAKSGFVHLFTLAFRKQFGERSAYDFICEYTKNKDLRTLMTYASADLGTVASQTHFPLYALVLNHYKTDGGFYPIGGASELSMALVPIIERAGGRVMVRANVEEILHDGRRVCGVRVRKGTTNLVYDLHAPIIVSTAGMYNTFEKLLPKHVAKKSYFHGMADKIGPSMAAIYAFIGLNASGEELCLPKENVFWFKKNDNGESCWTEWGNLPIEDALKQCAPAAFVGVQSPKNPNWNKNPDHQNKSTIFVASAVPYEWFKEFEDSTLLKRGDDYERIKATLGEKLLDVALEVYPQIRHHIDHVEYATPLTNNTYFGQHFGESYGMQANATRFKDPWLTAKLRPETDVPGLFLAGQDCFFPGILPGFLSAVATASNILERNLLIDLLWLHFKSKLQDMKTEKSEKQNGTETQAQLAKHG